MSTDRPAAPWPAITDQEVAVMEQICREMGLHRQPVRDTLRVIERMRRAEAALAAPVPSAAEAMHEACLSNPAGNYSQTPLPITDDGQRDPDAVRVAALREAVAACDAERKYYASVREYSIAAGAELARSAILILIEKGETK